MNYYVNNADFDTLKAKLYVKMVLDLERYLNGYKM